MFGPDASIGVGSTTSLQLLSFVQYDDFVPCDYNRDGFVDLLCLSSYLSTSYGYTGVGNGIFVEGPTIDLPFRPAAAVPVSQDPLAGKGVLLVGSDGTISVFYPVVGEDPPVGASGKPVYALRIDTSLRGTYFAVYEETETSVKIFELSAGLVVERGASQRTRTASAREWYEAVLQWEAVGPLSTSFPVPPEGQEATICIQDLNDDAIPDLVYHEAGDLVLVLSRGQTPLVVEQLISSPALPLCIRVADVDGSGLPDIITLSPRGLVTVYLMDYEQL